MFLFNLKGGTYCLDVEEQEKILFELLNQKELNNISKYTGVIYKIINNILKSKEKDIYCPKNIEDIINTINTAFDKLPHFKAKKQFILYRGLEFTKEDYDKFITLDKIYDFGFISTSTSIETAKDFSKTNDSNYGVVMKIYFSKDFENKILPLKSISENERENEVLLPNGSTFLWIEDKNFKDEKFKTESGKNRIIRSYLYIPPNKNIKEINSQKK
jgi:hypothetical protein